MVLPIDKCSKRSFNNQSRFWFLIGIRFAELHSSSRQLINQRIHAYVPTNVQRFGVPPQTAGWRDSMVRKYIREGQAYILCPYGWTTNWIVSSYHDLISHCALVNPAVVQYMQLSSTPPALGSSTLRAARDMT